MISELQQREDWVARTYRLEADMVATIDELAAAYTAPQSRIVGVLLRIGLEELEAGRRYIQRKATHFTVELGQDANQVLEPGA